MSGAVVGAATAVGAGLAGVGTAAAVGIGGLAAGVGGEIANVAGISGGGSSGGGGGGSGGGSSSGGGGNIMSQQYSYYGPHPSTSPMSNSAGNKAENQNVTMPLDNKVATARVTDANQVPAAHDSKQPVGNDFESSWGNRLHNYIGYATRTLG